MVKIKHTHYSKTLVVFFVIVDCLLLMASFRTAFWVEFKTAFVPAGHYQAMLAVCILSWASASLIRGAYHPDKLRSLARITTGVLTTFLVYALIAGAFFSFQQLYQTSANFLLSVHSLFILLSIATKYAMLWVYSLSINSKENRSKAVIVGYTHTGRELHRFFRKNKIAGIEFMGFFDDEYNGRLIAGNLSELKDFCIRNNVREIYYALPHDHLLIKELTRFADDSFIHFGLVQDVTGLSYERLHTYNYGNEIPVLSYTSKSYSPAFTKVRNVPSAS